jgi:hypothetical protein
MLTSLEDEVTDGLQNVILQHANINTFVRHYAVEVDVDVQGIVRRTGTQTELVRFACSISASIDPDRPFKLSPEESRSLNELPMVLAQQEKVNERKRKWDYRQANLERANRAHQAVCGNSHHGISSEHQCQLQGKVCTIEDRALDAKRKFNKAVRELRNEKQRQRNHRIRENLQRYRDKQPMIDLERQLEGLIVDTKVMGALEHTRFVTPEFMLVIDTMLTMPGATVEAEYQRRINAINAVTAFYGVEEGRSISRSKKSGRRPAADDLPSSPAKRSRISTEDKTDIVLLKAIESVRIKSPNDRPRICFLCVGNPKLSLKDRIIEHTTPGSLTRHFLRKHVNPPWPTEGVACKVCEDGSFQQKSILLNHAEHAHGTVVRGRAQERLASQLNNTTFVTAECGH